MPSKIWKPHEDRMLCEVFARHGLRGRGEMRRLTGEDPRLALFRLMELILRDNGEALAAMKGWNKLARETGRGDEAMSQTRAEVVVQAMHGGTGVAPLLLALARSRGNTEGLATVRPGGKAKHALGADTGKATSHSKPGRLRQQQTPKQSFAASSSSSSSSASGNPHLVPASGGKRTKRSRAPSVIPPGVVDAPVDAVPSSSASSDALAPASSARAAAPSLRNQLNRVPLPAATSIAQPLLDGDSNALGDTVCHRCKSNIDEADILICDGCELEFHRKCLPVPLALVPHGEWRCQPCLADKLFGTPAAITKLFASPSCESAAPASKRCTPATVASAGRLSAALTTQIAMDRTPRRYGDRLPLLQ